MFLVSTLFALHADEQLLVTVPVAPMVGEAFAESDSLSLAALYEKMPVSWGPNKIDRALCPRIHQLLFNEIVILKEERGEQILVELPHVLLIDNERKIVKPALFWTLKKYCTSLNMLKKRALSLKYIPEPLSYAKPYTDYPDIITLTMPYHDLVTQKTYSAGTRFVKIGATYDKFCLVALYDSTKGQFVSAEIPESLCLESYQKNREDRIQNFVSIVQKWATTKQGYVPFVWGGNSLTQFCKNPHASLKSITCQNNTVKQYWEHKELLTQPYSGFDTSGLILRAAQICGIPYFYKNSTTAASLLRPLEQFEDLQEGDLLSIPGGLFVVSNINNNQCIAALGYQHGFGYLAVVSIGDVFENIHTYAELRDAYTNQYPLLLKRNNRTVQTIKEYTLLSLRSAWSD
jgi:hypothetical protein